MAARSRIMVATAECPIRNVWWRAATGEGRAVVSSRDGIARRMGGYFCTRPSLCCRCTLDYSFFPHPHALEYTTRTCYGLVVAGRVAVALALVVGGGRACC